MTRVKHEALVQVNVGSRCCSTGVFCLLCVLLFERKLVEKGFMHYNAKICMSDSANYVQINPYPPA